MSGLASILMLKTRRYYQQCLPETVQWMGLSLRSLLESSPGRKKKKTENLLSVTAIYAVDPHSQPKPSPPPIPPPTKSSISFNISTPLSMAQACQIQGKILLLDSKLREAVKTWKTFWPKRNKPEQII